VRLVQVAVNVHFYIASSVVIQYHFHPTASHLGIHHLKDVHEELIGVSHKWYNIGLELGLKNGDLDPIGQQSSDSMVNTREMAKRWLKNALFPTWAALADALSSPTVKEVQKAKELRQKKHCQTPISSEEKLKLTSGDSVLFIPGMLQYPTMFT